MAWTRKSIVVLGKRGVEIQTCLRKNVFCRGEGSDKTRLSVVISLSILGPTGRGGEIFMAFVKVDETEPLEKAIKRFKRMVEKEGVIRDYKMRRYFEKPSAIQHRKNKAMARKQMLKNKKMHASKAY